MPEALAPAAPVAAAPSAPAPSTAPIAAPSAPAAPAISPENFSDRNSFADAMLRDELSKIPSEDGETTEEVPVAQDAPVQQEAPPAPEVEAPVADQPATEEEPQIDFDPPAVVTPEALTQMVTDNPEFGRMLESDPRLKGQLYRTAREAAELQPYKEVFPDVQMAKDAAQTAIQFDGIRGTFLTATTPQGAAATIKAIQEMCYERNEDGSPVMRDGKPVIGSDWYGFENHVVSSSIQARAEQVRARLQQFNPRAVEDARSRAEANEYHLNPQLYRNQAEVQAAYNRDMQLVGEYGRDAQLLAAYDAISGTQTEPAAAEVPEQFKARAAELDAREQKIKDAEAGRQQQNAQQYRTDVVRSTDDRLMKGIDGFIAYAKKNGAVIHEFLEKSIKSEIWEQMKGKLKSPGIELEMNGLMKLPSNDVSKQRILAAADKHFQSILPEIGPQVLARAGIQLTATAKARADKSAAQAARSSQTEIQGAHGATGGSPKVMSAEQAEAQAQKEWEQKHPGQIFGPSERNQIIGRWIQLMTGAA